MYHREILVACCLALDVGSTPDRDQISGVAVQAIRLLANSCVDEGKVDSNKRCGFADTW